MVRCFFFKHIYLFCLQADDISRLCENNRRLQTDIQMYLNEIDMYRNGQSEYGEEIRLRVKDNYCCSIKVYATVVLIMKKQLLICLLNKKYAYMCLHVNFVDRSVLTSKQTDE